MKSILLTAIGGDLAQSVAKIIRDYNSRVKIIGIDIAERHGGKILVDKFYVVPPASSPTYANSIRNIISNNDVDLVIPLSEHELSFFHENLSVERICQWVGAGVRTIETGLDKWKTFKVLSEAGIGMPWTVKCKDNDPVSLPCIVKSRHGSGSKSVERVNGESDVVYFKEKFKDGIFQELLASDEEEITCAVYRDKSGKVMTLQMLRKLDDGGATSWVKIVDFNSIDVLCTKVAEELDLKGSANIQLRMTQQGPRIFEINPRFSSTVMMRHKLGFTDVLWTLMELNSEKIKYQKVDPGIEVAKTQDATIL